MTNQCYQKGFLMINRTVSNNYMIIILSFLVFISATLVEAKSLSSDLKFAGALEFSDTGILFIGDNYNGAIYALDFTNAPLLSNKKLKEVSIIEIDKKIANTLGVSQDSLEINDMAVHPKSKEVFISITRIGKNSSPALIKITQMGKLNVLNLNNIKFTKQNLSNYPDKKTTFRARGMMGSPPAPRDLTKAKRKISSMAIMDIEFHEREILVAGVAYENFLSTLRRIPYPFNGSQTATAIKIYHIAHDQYETRAPIRSMSVQRIDGKDQLVAAYTCSPVVIIPLDDLKDGAKITGKTIGDMGNGQPLDMVPYKINGKNALFISNNSRSPQVMYIDELQGAKTVTEKDFPRGPKLDMNKGVPYGPVGHIVMFEGSSLHIDLLGDKHFVSLSRDAYSGSLNLDTVSTFVPFRLHNLIGESDFPNIGK